MPESGRVGFIITLEEQRDAGSAAALMAIAVARGLNRSRPYRSHRDLATGNMIFEQAASDILESRSDVRQRC